MLDDAERAVLAETERSLTADPRFRRRFRGGWRSRRSRLRVTIVAAALLFVIGLGWLGLPGDALVVALLAVAVLVWTGWRPSDLLPATWRDN
jgi:hypothetical protein